MVTAVAGMVDPVRVAEIIDAVSRTRASVLLASDCIYDLGLLRFLETKQAWSFRQTPYEVCEFVTAQSGACEPAAFHQV